MSMLLSAMLASGMMAGGVVSRVAPAEKLQLTGTVTTGTGLSMASAGGETLAERSPTFLNVEVGFTHPSIPWFEISPGLMLELEGRVGVGINPKFRAVLPFRRARVYGLVGVPIFFAPYSLLGVQGGAGFAVSVHPHVALVSELSASAFFWGSDLMDDSILGKLDFAFGVRVMF